MMSQQNKIASLLARESDKAEKLRDKFRVLLSETNQIHEESIRLYTDFCEEEFRFFSEIPDEKEIDPIQEMELMRINACKMYYANIFLPYTNFIIDMESKSKGLLKLVDDEGAQAKKYRKMYFEFMELIAKEVIDGKIKDLIPK